MQREPRDLAGAVALEVELCVDDLVEKVIGLVRVYRQRGLAGELRVELTAVSRDREHHLRRKLVPADVRVELLHRERELCDRRRDRLAVCTDSIRTHVLAILMQRERHDLAIGAALERELRVDHLREELVRRVSVDRQRVLAGELHEKTVARMRDGKRGLRRDLVSGYELVELLRRERDLRVDLRQRRGRAQQMETDLIDRTDALV